MNIGRTDITPTNLPGADTITDNGYLDVIQESLNIDVQYPLMVGGMSDYPTKINMIIASRDLPDVLYINNMAQLKQLVAADLLADLTGAYEMYASPVTKGFYESYGSDANPSGLAASTFGGKLLALPNTNLGQGYPIVWARKDWMDAVGAKPPETLDDVITLAKLFMEKDSGGNGEGKTVGLPVGNWLVGYNRGHGLDGIFAMYGAYPETWIQTGGGSYVYSSVAPEARDARDALAKLAGMYAEKVIDPQFVTNNPDTLVSAGKAGLMLGPWWMPMNIINSTYRKTKP